RTFLTRPFSFFFNDTPTTQIYTLSLHDALPISLRKIQGVVRLTTRARRTALDAHAVARSASLPLIAVRDVPHRARDGRGRARCGDRKSTRLNSSHSQISYAVFCLKKKKKTKKKI